MNLFPKISIITPSFNQGQFIEKTITSIIDQNYPNLEFIIIDGGSVDNTVEIIEKYEKHLKYWVSEKDDGQSDAINKGLRIATGDIVNWINSDDYLDEGVLFKIARAFEKSDVHIVCGYANLISSESTLKKRTSELADNYEHFLALGHIMQPATFFRKSIFDQFTPLERSLHFMMDHYLWLQYIVMYGTKCIVYVDYVIANVVMHHDAKSFKQIKLFANDRELIYSSLFKSYNHSFIFPDNKVMSQKVLSFKNGLEEVKTRLELVNFYLLINNLFNRDAFGKRMNLNLNCLFLLLRYFPGKTVAYFLSKF